MPSFLFVFLDYKTKGNKKSPQFECDDCCMVVIGGLEPPTLWV